MSEGRKLEPAPGWCERATAKLRILTASTNDVICRETVELCNQFEDARVEYESAKPEPGTKLKHGDTGHFILPSGVEMPSRIDKNEPGMRGEPEAQSAELPFDIRCQCSNIFPGDTVKQFCLRGFAIALLAEARRIADQRIASKAIDIQTQHWGPGEVATVIRRIAREEIEAATKAGVK